jgi:hypothetical protein
MIVARSPDERARMTADRARGAGCKPLLLVEVAGTPVRQRMRVADGAARQLRTGAQTG